MFFFLLRLQLPPLLLLLSSAVLSIARPAPEGAAAAATTNPLLVNLGDCTSYNGNDMGNGLNSWLGIRFAAPPVGDLRFRAPQAPECDHQVHQANQHGDLCFSTGQSVPDGHSEDCLFLDVYAPSQTNPDTTAGGWPVFIFIQGGGLNSLANPNMNPASFIQSAGTNFVVVTFNYRVGLYGFLTSKEVAANGNLNVGLLDQRAVFKWVQSNISRFGGNPGHVVLGGDSGGAASIDLHLSAYGGRNDNLFHAAALESQSFGAELKVEGAQYQYDALVQRLNCHSSTDTLACLRGLDVHTIQSQNINIPTPGGAGGTPIYMYSAVIDGDFARDFTYNAFANGAFIKVPVIFGDTTNEGTEFVPNTIQSYAQANDFLKNNWVNLTPDQLSKLDSLYPPAETFPNTGALWRTASNIYGEMRYICPGLYLSSSYDKYGVENTYNYRWDIGDPNDIASGIGVRHVQELNHIWDGGDGTVSSIQGYWTSFIRSFNPNTYAPQGSTTWDRFNTTDKHRILFHTGNTLMEPVPAAQTDRCSYLGSIGAALQQ